MMMYALLICTDERRGAKKTFSLLVIDEEMLVRAPLV